ncbi:Bax inhibitor-1/YccA family protein [Bacillus mobilis]|uniref:Bax inhibitor-1/YccA family protein n=1 Tax=Bacillus mobilis TaxID=2026190 RepID=UPI002E236E65|nr:Bax inhibitor-1/YccA family protein [Bacillus mobilis]
MKNPMLKDKEKFQQSSINEEHMTVGGTVAKTFIYLILLLGASLYSFMQIQNGTMGMKASVGLIIGVLIGSFVISLITASVPKIAWLTAPIYATLEGVLIGFISTVIEHKYPGIVVQAVLATIGVVMAMLFLYATRIIKVNEKFLNVVKIATLSVLIIYLVDIALMLCGVPIPFLHDSSPLSIGISLIIIGIASLNLLADFFFIEEGVNAKAPKYMEAYFGFALLVSIVWLYLEILKWLEKIRK